MEKQFDNTNKGVIFKNEKKASDKHPDYQGTINVDGIVALFFKLWNQKYIISQQWKSGLSSKH